MNKYLKELGWVVGYIGVAVVQMAFIASNSGLNQIINLVLLTALLLTIFGYTKKGVACAAIGAYLVDLNSALPFGLILSGVMASLVIAIILKNRVLKNHAFHAFAIITGLATLSYHIIFTSQIAIYNSLQTARLSLELTTAVQAAFIQSIVHIIAVAFIYYSIGFFQNRLLHSNATI